MSESSDDLEAQKARHKKNLAVRTSLIGTFNDVLNHVVGTEKRKGFRDRLDARGNIPSLEGYFMPSAEFIPGFLDRSEKLWIVDRILEHNTLSQFFKVAQGQMPLPGGKTINQPIDDPDLVLIMQPYSDWASSPFNTNESVPSTTMAMYIASADEEGRERLQLVSKELHAMKVRIWSGIMPLSARRWRDEELYEPKNFPAACRILSMAVNVFLYLNHPDVQAALRETFVLIDRELRAFEAAWNAKRTSEGKPAIEVSSKWHEFIRAKYAVMVNRTHSWVMEHVTHMKTLVLQQVEELAAPDGNLDPDVFDERMRLADMWQDITEIASQADYAILLPMDGYDGSPIEPPRTDPKVATKRLRISPYLDQRRFDYHTRRGHLLMKKGREEFVEAMYGAPGSQPSNTLTRMQQQDVTQHEARVELRGEPICYEQEPWTAHIGDDEAWGFVIYRTCHSCSGAEWSEFRARFDADQVAWGSELAGVEGLRERSKIFWLDAKDLGVDGEDLEALKSLFKSFTDAEDFPSGFATDMFLVADEASVSSYLNPQLDPASQGDSRGSIRVVDADFDASKGIERPQESPGYNGTFRVLSSLLWDDLSALIASYCEELEKIWPLAMNHASHVYVGPTVKVLMPPGSP